MATGLTSNSPLRSPLPGAPTVMVAGGGHARLPPNGPWRRTPINSPGETLAVRSCGQRSGSSRDGWNQGWIRYGGLIVETRRTGPETRYEGTSRIAVPDRQRATPGKSQTCPPGALSGRGDRVHGTGSLTGFPEFSFTMIGDTQAFRLFGSHSKAHHRDDRDHVRKRQQYLVRYLHPDALCLQLERLRETRTPAPQA